MSSKFWQRCWRKAFGSAANDGGLVCDYYERSTSAGTPDFACGQAAAFEVTLKPASLGTALRCTAHFVALKNGLSLPGAKAQIAQVRPIKK